METGLPAYFRKAIVVALWVPPVLCAFYFVWRHCVPLPFWDEWSTPGAQLASWYRGTLTFAELCSQHPADCVVVGWQTAAGWEPRWIVELNQPSSNPGAGARFSWPLLARVPASGATLRAWLIDLQHSQAYALADAINLTP